MIDRMMQTTPLSNGNSNDYAYGLVINEFNGMTRVSHGGSWAGFRTALHHFPEQDFSVIVLINAPILNTFRIAENIAMIYLSDKSSEEREDSENVNFEEPQFVKVPISILDEYLGTYKLGSGWYVTITRENDQLITTATNEPSFPMKPTSQTDFLVPDYSNRFIKFKRGDKGQVSHFEYNGLKCPRMEGGASKISEDMEGKYFSDELWTTYEIEVEGDHLIAKHPHNGKIRLTPMWEGEFAGERFYIGSVEFKKDENGKVNSMIISSGRSRNQVFQKMKLD